MPEQYYHSRIPETAEKVFHGQSHDVYQWSQQLYDGSDATFEVVKRLDAVSVIVVTDTNQIVMLYEEQPRRAPYWAMPGGYLERQDQTPLDAAQRELREETGISCAQWTLVAVESRSDPRFEFYIYRFVASKIIERARPRQEAGERIVVHELPFARVQEICRDSPFTAQKIMAQARSTSDLLTLSPLQPL